MKKYIPNLLTLMNLALGTVAAVLVLEGSWQWAVYLLLAASLFDFLDGLAARLLSAGSETGKQLDSLADMVTFGVVPAFFLYSILRQQFAETGAGDLPRALQWGMMISLVIIPLFTAIRLARFNTSDPDEHFFRGLPTPAHALFWAGLFWQYMERGSLFGTSLNTLFLWAIMWVMATYMILPLPMYTLKFGNFRLRGNLVRYLLVAVSAVILLMAGIPGLSFVVLVYILFSLLSQLLQIRVLIP